MNGRIAKQDSTGVRMGIHSLSGRAGGSGGGAGSVSQHSADVLSSVIVKPVFWGSQWFHPTTPSAGQILWAIRSIFMGPFMSGLAQYGVGNGSLDPNPVFTGFAPDPPQNFTHADIEGMLAGLVDSGQIPDPLTNRQVLPCVFTPLGIAFTDPNAAGFHTSFSHLTELVPYAWVGNIGDLDATSAFFSHELAESCTNPFGHGVFGDPGSCGQTGQCEISDYCYGNTAGLGSGELGGVNVSAYWSIRDGRCFLPQERSVPGRVRGNPALIQGRFFSPGNFELVTPLASGGLAHYSRVNIDPALPWAGPETFGEDLGVVDAVSMIQSNFTTGGPGNLEVVAHWSGELLCFWREDIPPYVWHGPFEFPLNLPGPGTVAGNPSMIQGRFGNRGNFELVTPVGSGGLAHYWRDNDDPSLSWHGPTIFAEELGVVDAVSLIQSDFGSPGGAGHLELIARVGSVLVHYWRQDVAPFQWFGPEVLPLSAPGQNDRIAIGYPSFIESRFGPFLKGYFQVVTPLAGGGLAHYTRDNNTPGLPWNGPEVFGAEFGAFDAVSLIQSTFSSSNTGIGNLELVTAYNSVLLHCWREDTTQIADVTDFSGRWYGPWI